MLKTKLRMTLVALMIAATSSALGYVTVQAAHPFVHPTWPEVKTKYWSYAEKNGTATAVFSVAVFTQVRSAIGRR